MAEPPDRRVAFVGIGVEIVGIIVGGVWIGGYLDKTYNLNGMGTVGFILVGMVVWFVHLIQMLKTFERDRKRDD